MYCPYYVPNAFRNTFLSSDRRGVQWNRFYNCYIYLNRPETPTLLTCFVLIPIFSIFRWQHNFRSEIRDELWEMGEKKKFII